MTAASADLTTAELAQLLRAVAATEPAPWYAGDHARKSGQSRDTLDEPLAQLRFGGFVRLTDWEAGKGQGYLLTTEGRRALNDPARLRRTRVTDTVSQPSEDVPVLDRDPAVTRMLVTAQVGVFVICFLQALEGGVSADQFLASGKAPVESIQYEFAVSAAHLRQGAWWTLLSYALVHGGLLHLGCNLFGHVVEASLVERLLGRWRFVAVYLVAVWCGGVGAVLANPGSPTVGSSGGLCGVLAAEMVWAVFNRHLFRATEWTRVMQGFVRAIVMITIISAIPGVSWGGHLGGAIGGGLVTAVSQFGVAGPRWRRIASWASVTLVPVIAAIIVWKRLT